MRYRYFIFLISTLTLTSFSQQFSLPEMLSNWAHKCPLELKTISKIQLNYNLEDKSLVALVTANFINNTNQTLRLDYISGTATLIPKSSANTTNPELNERMLIGNFKLLRLELPPHTQIDSPESTSQVKLELGKFSLEPDPQNENIDKMNNFIKIFNLFNNPELNKEITICFNGKCYPYITFLNGTKLRINAKGPTVFEWLAQPRVNQTIFLSPAN